MKALKIGQTVMHKYGSFKVGTVIGTEGKKVKVYFTEEQAPAIYKGKIKARIRTIYPSSVNLVK